LLQIRGKILAALMAVVLLMLAPTIYAVVCLRRLNRITGELRASHDLQIERQLKQLGQCKTFQSLFVATGDADYRRAAGDCAVALRAAVRQIAASLEDRDPERSRDLREAARLYAQLVRRHGAGAAPAAGPGDATGPDPTWRREEQERRLEVLLREIEAGETAFRADQARTAGAVGARAVGALWICLLLSLAAALVITSLLTRQIVRPLRRLVVGTRRIARGQFDEEMPVTGRDELGVLTQAFNRMSSDLASLERMKAEFISVASHELRSPVTSILGTLEVLRAEGEAAPSEEERGRLLDQIADEAALLTRYIDELLDISRIETGRLEIAPRLLPAAAFFEHEVEGFSVAARRDGVELRTEISGGVPDEIRVDPDRMGQVVRNLVENALGFTPSGGEVVVRLEREDGAVRFEVQDSGPGIRPEELDLVFRKYYRGSARRARGGKGSGLGLAISRAIVEAHGGRLWAESAPPAGGGRFICRLPAHPPAREGEERP
jgi:signal transduction histidine kinase